MIAGFDMTQGGQAITFLLASSGVAQLGQAVLCALAALRYREFAVPLLAVEAAKNWGASAMAFVFKPPPVDVPGKTGMAVAAVVLTAGLVWEFARPGRRV